MARIAVRDTGPGIDPADFEVIFEEFRRLSHDRGPTGKGLGLAIVRRASQMLGHTIELSSTPGQGAEFAVLVPVCPALRVDAPAQRPRERATGEASGGRVLIIDNDEAILQGMQALLGKWGYRVMVAPSLDAALDLPALNVAGPEGLPALIIADYHLDDGERGDAVIGALRRQLGAQVPALVISADRSEEVKAQLAAASLPMLHKPVKPAQLRALLRTLVN